MQTAMEQGVDLVGGQLLAMQQGKNLSNDCVRRFCEEVGFGERRGLGGYLPLAVFWPGGSSGAAHEWRQGCPAW